MRVGYGFGGIDIDCALHAVAWLTGTGGTTQVSVLLRGGGIINGFWSYQTMRTTSSDGGVGTLLAHLVRVYSSTGLLKVALLNPLRRRAFAQEELKRTKCPHNRRTL